MSVIFNALRSRSRTAIQRQVSSLNRIRPTREWTAVRHYTEQAPKAITPVEKILLDSIKASLDVLLSIQYIEHSNQATGPLPFATYMQLCLSHPTHGYYMNASNPVFGSQGDFITSPEISQVFGELVGIWLLSQWAEMGQASKIRLIELGPGRGTLMDDVLRVISRITKGKGVESVHFVETSKALREVQKQKLEPFTSKTGCKIEWHDTIEEVPSAPDTFSMVIAHEFFDALPVHVLQKTEKGWNEVLIASSAEPLKDPRADPKLVQVPPTPSPGPQSSFRRVLSPTPSMASTVLGVSSTRFHNLPLGSTIEVSPASFKIARRIGELLDPSEKAAEDKEKFKGSQGCGLIIDYGGAKAFGDSFRAFRNHKLVDVFHRPGECDLTANVDFAYLHEAMGDLVNTHGPISQGSFLENMGLKLRVDALAKHAQSEERRETIQKAADRLIDKTGMGTQYQVMGITSRKPGQSPVWPFVDMPAQK